MTGFNSAYAAVFNAVKAMLTYMPAIQHVPAVPAHDDVPEVPEVLAVAASGVAAIKTVVLGAQFTLGDLPLVIIGAKEALIEPATQGNGLLVHIYFKVTVVIREYTKADWFTDLIPVMCDVVDAVLADCKLGGTVLDCLPKGFFPGEATFEDKVLCAGEVHFLADVLYSF